MSAYLAAAFWPLRTRTRKGGGGGGGICACSSGACAWAAETLAVETSLLVCGASLFIFLASFVFSVYVGIGFIALPGYLISVYTERPRLLTTAEVRTQRRILSSRAADLIGVGEGLAARVLERHEAAVFSGSWLQRRARKAEERAEIARLRVLSAALESDLDALALADPREWRERYNPLEPLTFLLGGLLSIVLSAAWLVHLVLNVLFEPPLAPVLDGLLARINHLLPMLADALLALLALYLLCAAAAGAMALGARLFLINAHRLEAGRTPVSALLVLAESLLLCVLPCVQLLARSFRDFARHTDAGVLFALQVESLDGLRVFYTYSIFLLLTLGVALLAIVYFACRPSQRAHLRAALDAMKARRSRAFRAAERRVERAEASSASGAAPAPPTPPHGRVRKAEQRRAASVSIELPAWRHVPVAARLDGGEA